MLTLLFYLFYLCVNLYLMVLLHQWRGSHQHKTCLLFVLIICHFSFRDISKYMRENNVLGSSRGYIDRILKSYDAVTLEKVQKYFLSTLKFAELYLQGETAYTVNERMAALRKIHKSHREGALFTVDHSKKVYNRNRMSWFILRHWSSYNSL